MTDAAPETVTDLGETSDVGAVRGVLALDGLRVADVGCGPGLISRELARAGARVLGIEPDPIQAEKNRAAEPFPGLSFAEARAECLPVEPGSLDAVFFFRSLHHVPVPAMDAALAEAARVLKPGGTLCVVEPGMEGTHFPVMRPFHDETVVRNAAQAALARTAAKLFASARHYRWVQYVRYPDFAAMVSRVTGQTFNSITRDRVETAEVRALFEAGQTAAGDYAFDQPMLMAVYR